MVKLAKYLKKSAGYVVLIIALLFLQAYCDLELPNYTSKIVNEGIQQKGIEDGVPEKLRAETFENLELLLDAQEKELLEGSYTAADDSYKLNSGITEEDREALGSALQEAELVLYYLAQDGAAAGMSSETGSASASEASSMADSAAEVSGAADGAAEKSDEADSAAGVSAEGNRGAAMAAALPEGTDLIAVLKVLPETVRAQLRAGIHEKVGAMSETMREQTAVAFVQQEYEAMGENLASRQTGYLLRVGGRMLLLALIAMLATVCVTFLSSRLAARTAHDLRNDVYRKVIGFNSEEFNRFSTASLITRSTNDIQQVQTLLAMGFRILLYAPILGIGGVLKVIQTDVSMSWILAIAVAAILAVVAVLFLVAMPRFTKLQTLIDRLNLVTREQLTGVMVTRAFSAERHEEERFEMANSELTRTNLFVNRCMTFMMPTMMLIMNGVSVLIVYNGAHAVDDGLMQVGDMMAFIQYAMQIIMSFLMITVMSIMIPRANVAANRIVEVLNTEVELKDPQQPKTPSDGVRGTVEFDHVSFAYPDADEKMLDDISFKAERGQTVAFIGSTGSGKSTLIKLIPRFFDVTEGSVRVDGVDVREMTKKDLCSRLGYVPQKSTLFSGTIDSNIRYGRTDATEEEVKQAAAIAQATEFIEAREEQYASPIAQGGTNVSGGQKQRLSIARAIAKNPEILIFDDSFSALDFKTDVALRKALKESTKDITTLIVAQRISTILHADQIIVLDEGRMVGKGTHAELMKSCEVYRQIATSQLSEEELAG